MNTIFSAIHRAHVKSGAPGAIMRLVESRQTYVVLHDNVVREFQFKLLPPSDYQDIGPRMRI